MVPDAASIFCRRGIRLFNVRGGGYAFSGLTAREAASRAKALRRTGLNDVEIFRSDDTRISQYSLDQIVRSEADNRNQL